MADRGPPASQSHAEKPKGRRSCRKTGCVGNASQAFSGETYGRGGPEERRQRIGGSSCGDLHRMRQKTRVTACCQDLCKNFAAMTIDGSGRKGDEARFDHLQKTPSLHSALWQRSLLTAYAKPLQPSRCEMRQKGSGGRNRVPRCFRCLFVLPSVPPVPVALGPRDREPKRSS